MLKRLKIQNGFPKETRLELTVRVQYKTIEHASLSLIPWYGPWFVAFPSSKVWMWVTETGIGSVGAIVVRKK